MSMKRHVSAYIEAIFRFTNAGYIETNVGTVWLDVEISSSRLYSVTGGEYIQGVTGGMCHTS
jgi:hypothetical protein